MKYIPRGEVEWIKTKIIKIHEDGPEEKHLWKYEFLLPRPLADWDVFAVWERERFQSMEDNLNQGDILFDIGTEQGWCNLIYAQFVGPENIVLIEPTQEFWPNIEATWEKNYPDLQPQGFYDGLLSDKTSDKRKHGFTTWPDASGGPLIDRNKYQYIHDNDENVPELKLDDYVARTGIVPDALTMDTEGAEILILRGAEKTLREHKPLVWASLHPDLAVEYGYGDVQNIHDFMSSLGYKSRELAVDHEVHTIFWHKDSPEPK